MKWTGASSAFSAQHVWWTTKSKASLHEGAIEPNVGRVSSIARLNVLAPEREWRAEVEKKLENLIRLEIGWDGYRAEPVSLETANFALRMLESICQSSVPTPEIVPGTNGDVQIEWHTDKGDVELHVRRANNVHAWRRTNATGPNGEDYQLTVNFLPILGWIDELSEPVVNAEAAAA